MRDSSSAAWYSGPRTATTDLGHNHTHTSGQFRVTINLEYPENNQENIQFLHREAKPLTTLPRCDHVYFEYVSVMSQTRSAISRDSK